MRTDHTPLHATCDTDMAGVISERDHLGRRLDAPEGCAGPPTTDGTEDRLSAAPVPPSLDQVQSRLLQSGAGMLSSRGSHTAEEWRTPHVSQRLFSRAQHQQAGPVVNGVDLSGHGQDDASSGRGGSNGSSPSRPLLRRASSGSSRGSGDLSTLARDLAALSADSRSLGGSQNAEAPSPMQQDLLSAGMGPEGDGLEASGPRDTDSLTQGLGSGEGAGQGAALTAIEVDLVDRELGLSGSGARPAGAAAASATGGAGAGREATRGEGVKAERRSRQRRRHSSAESIVSSTARSSMSAPLDPPLPPHPDPRGRSSRDGPEAASHQQAGNGDTKGRPAVTAGRRGEGEAGEEGPQLCPSVKEAWLCPICLQTYDEPCAISLCSHNFCRSCLNALSQASTPTNQPNQRNDPHAPRSLHCPLCRVEFSSEHVACNRPLLAEMQAALIRCGNKGCSLVYCPLYNKKHQDECPFSPSSCPHQPHGCPYKALRKDMAEHLQACPFEHIKGFFPKLRASLDQTTAAMRGWENGFISQQQMLATHTAMLRNLERKSHHNPLDHIKLATLVFWHPYLWPYEAERWSRSFSFPVSAMVFYLLPIVLSLVSTATRRSPYLPLPPSPNAPPFPSEWTLLHHPAAGDGPLPYPLLGLACHGPANTDCYLGVSPKVSWLFLLLLLLTSYVEAYHNSDWLGSLRLWSTGAPTPSASRTPSPAPPAPPPRPSASTPSPSNAPRPPTPGAPLTEPPSPPHMSLQLTRYVLCTCVAWASFALGGGPWAGLLYLCLACMLPVAFAMQLVARTCCKFQRPVIRGLVFGLMLRCFTWQNVAGSFVLTGLLCRGLAGLCSTSGGLITYILTRLPVKLEDLGPLTMWGTSPGCKLLSPVFIALSAALLYHLDGLQIVYCLCMQLALEALSVASMYAMEKLLARAMRAPRPGTPVPPERRGDLLCVLYTRAVLLLALFAAAVICLL